MSGSEQHLGNVEPFLGVPRRGICLANRNLNATKKNPPLLMLTMKHEKQSTYCEHNSPVLEDLVCVESSGKSQLDLQQDSPLLWRRPALGI
jgi:hypothetical protein